MITADTIDGILRFQGGGLPVVSLYARFDPGASLRELRTRVSSLLDGIQPVAKDGAAGRAQRLSLRGDIARIRDAVSSERWRAGTLAIFTCSGRDWYAEVQLPQPVHDRVMVDATRSPSRCSRSLEEHERCLVAVVDRASARFWELYQDDVHELGRVRDQKLRKSNFAAGFAEYRVRNKADELAKRHYRHVAEVLGDVLQPRGYDVVVIGGHQYEIPDFLQQLPRELRALVAGTFSVDPGTAALAEIRGSAAAIAARHEHERDQQLADDIQAKAAMGGLATVGLDTCLWAGSVGAVQTLLVRQGASAAGVVCDVSGWLALSGDTCPVCGNSTRRTPDVVDELVQAVITESGAVHHIAPDGGLGGYVTGAELRFPLPEVAS